MTSKVELHLGDCLEILPTLEDNSVDAVITDPPYGIGYASSRMTRPDGTPRRIDASFGNDVIIDGWIGEACRKSKDNAFLSVFTIGEATLAERSPPDE